MHKYFYGFALIAATWLAWLFCWVVITYAAYFVHGLVEAF